MCGRLDWSRDRAERGVIPSAATGRGASFRVATPPTGCRLIATPHPAELGPWSSIEDALGGARRRKRHLAAGPLEGGPILAARSQGRGFAVATNGMAKDPQHRRHIIPGREAGLDERPSPTPPPARQALLPALGFGRLTSPIPIRANGRSCQVSIGGLLVFQCREQSTDRPAAGSPGRRFSLRSAMRSTIAPDSNSFRPFSS